MDPDFLKAIQDVTPLKSGERRVLPTTTPLDPVTARARRAAATAQAPTDGNPLTIPEHIDPCDPHDIAGERKDGVQIGVYRKLRLGKYVIAARLDLHRKTLAQARIAVHQFLQQAHHQQHRCVLITHGKGRTALVKSHTWHWLHQHPLVLAWHSAIPRHGGAGASYVLLKKRHADQPASASHRDP